MTISVLVNGALGRMGQTVVHTIAQYPQFTLAGQTDKEDDVNAAIQKLAAQVVVDFTHPEAALENTLMILAAGAHPVIGTTGLKAKDIEIIRARCAELKRGAVIAPNFSLAAVLMMKAAQAMAKYLPHVEIIELHHNGKADSPSGTALRTAEMIAAANPALNKDMPAQRETIAGARGATHHHIPIHAVRLPGLLAHEEIIFGNAGETLTLRHDSLDRQCFMPGVFLACEKVVGLRELVVGLENLL